MLQNKTSIPYDTVRLIDKKIIFICKNETDISVTEDTIMQNITDINTNIETKSDSVVKFESKEDDLISCNHFEIQDLSVFNR